MIPPNTPPSAVNASDFKFTCPFCQQHLACEDNLRGTRIQCPSCQGDISIPAPLGLTAQASTVGHSVGDYAPPVMPGRAPKIRISGK